MAEFRKMIITTTGKELLAKVLAKSVTFTFTKAAISMRNYADEEIVELEQLEIHQELPVYKVLCDEDSTVQVTAVLDNTEVITSYQYASIGLYAQIADEPEALFAVCGSNVPGHVPSNNSPFVVFLNLRIGFSDSESVAFQRYLLEQKIGTEIAERILWSSKHMVERLCPPLEISGQAVECHPIAGYPLKIYVNKPNVIHYEYATDDNPHVDSGITFTRRADGSILVDGTAAYDAHYCIFSGYGGDNPLMAAGVPVGTTLRLHGAPAGSSERTYELYYYTGMAAVGDVGVTHHDYGDGVSFTTLERDYEVAYGWECGIRIRQGVICDHLVFHPHLEMVGDLILNVQTSEGLTSLPLTDSSVFEMPAVEGRMSFAISGDATVTVCGREDVINNIEMLKSKLEIAEREFSQMVDKATFSLASNALKGSVQGGAVSMADVSPIEHELRVKVSSNSKNLFDATQEATEISLGGNFHFGYMLTLPAGTYTISGDRLADDYDYSRAWVKGYIYDAYDNIMSEMYLYVGSDMHDTRDDLVPYTFTLNEGDRLVIDFYNAAADTEAINHFNIQVEEGEVETPYMPFVDVEGAVVSQYGSSNLLWFKDFHYSTDARKDIMVNGVFTVSSVQDFASTNIISATRFKAQYCGVEVFPAGTYIFSAKTINYYGTKTPYLLVKLADGTTEQFMAGEAKTVTQSFTPTSILTQEYGLYEGESYTTTFKFEVGDTATPYEPFTECIATAAVNADGTVDGLISRYPSTSLLTDTDGAIIECEYNKDLNKAYDALVQAIISLGGNV